jgi:hypothetical protein
MLRVRPALFDLVARKRAVDERRLDALLLQAFDLILHKRNEGRHHQHQSVRQKRRNLVAQ